MALRTSAQAERSALFRHRAEAIEVVVGVRGRDAGRVVRGHRLQVPRRIVSVRQRPFGRLLLREPVHGIVEVAGGPAGVGHGFARAGWPVGVADGGIAGHAVRRRAREQPVELVVGIGCDRAAEMRDGLQVTVVVVGARLGVRGVGQGFLRQLAQQIEDVRGGVPVGVFEGDGVAVGVVAVDGGVGVGAWTN